MALLSISDAKKSKLDALNAAYTKGTETIAKTGRSSSLEALLNMTRKRLQLEGVEPVDASGGQLQLI